MTSQYKRYILKNGTRLILVPDNTKQVVTTLVVFGVGSRYESKEEAGISHVLEHMFYKGTKKRPSAMAIAEFIEGVGGEHNAFTSKEYTGFYVKTASKYVDQSIDFLSDLMMNPSFDAAELEKEKEVILQELDMYEDLPMEVAASKFESALFGDNPLGWDVIGSKTSIKSIGRDNLVSYKSKFYTGTNSVIVLAGNFGGKSEEQIRQTVEESFGFADGEKVVHPPVQIKNGINLNVIKRKTEQSHLVIGFRGAPSNEPDRYKLKMLALILGGSMSSRMFTEIREKRGLAYAVHSGASSYLDTGAIETYAGVPHTKVEEAVAAILNEYKKIRENLTAGELAKAKEIIYGKKLISMEDTNELANHYGLEELLGEELITPQDVVGIYQKITLPELASCANKYLVDSSLTLSFVGRDLTEFRAKAILKL